MVLKGYYASASLGFDLLFSAVGAIAGLGMIAIGCLVMLGEPTVTFGFKWLGVAGIIAGTLGFLSGVLAVTGGCTEKSQLINFSVTIAVLALIAGGGVAAYGIMMSRSVNQNARKTWSSMKPPQKVAIEKRYVCCGFTKVEERTEDCKPEKPCEKSVVGELAGRLKLTMIFAAVVAALQIGITLCGCIVGHKMQRQQTHKVLKDIERADKRVHKREKASAKREIKRDKERQLGYMKATEEAEKAKKAEKGRKGRKG